MVRASLRIGCIFGTFTCAIVALALAGAGCSSSSDEEAERLGVRTASGAVTDVTDTAWAQCYPEEPSPGMSRLTTHAFGAGTFTLTDVIYTESVDCTGPSDGALGGTATARTSAQGDRAVGWDDGPPPGLGATVTATAVLLTGATPGSNLPDPMKTLFFVNDLVSPPELHMGGKAGVAADGYPTTLEISGRPRVGP